MAKQYRAELRDLYRNGRKIFNDQVKFRKTVNAEVRKLEASVNRADKSSSSALRRINKRIAILEGRLS